MNRNEDYQRSFDDLARRIGQCLHNWAVCEVYLSLLFHAVIRSQDSQSSHAAFSSVINMQAKLSATEKAAEKSIQCSALLYVVQKHTNRMRKLNNKRNELAHSCIRKFDGKPYVNPYFSLADNENDNKKFDAPIMAKTQNAFFELKLAMRWVAMKTWLHLEKSGEDPGLLPPLSMRILPNTFVAFNRKSKT